MSINIDLSQITPSGDGKYYEAYPDGDAPVSFGDDTLLATASNGLVSGQTMTITTDGTYSFGATGPSIVMLMDAADYSLGAADGTEIRQGSAAVLVEGGTFDVVADSNLPAGKGWQMGDETEFDRVWCDHTASTRLFESQTYYRSAASIVNSKLEDIDAWQMKPVWNMADRIFSGEGTNFFTLRPCVNTLTGQSVRPSSYISSNVTAINNFFTNSAVDDPADAQNYPYAVPYTMENLWDQGTADGVTADGTLDYFVTASNGLASARATPSGLQLTANKASKIINSFSYPGYFTGLEVATGCNLIDCEYYRAVGAGAACRVAITNNSDYFSASKRTILWTNSWADTSITVEIRGGWFNLPETTGLYINVLNASNVQIGSIAL